MTAASGELPSRETTILRTESLSLTGGVVWSMVALASFHAAQCLGIGWLLIPCAYALIELSRAPTNRKVFYPLLGLGVLFYAPHLSFFWRIFGPAAIALWVVLAFWIGLFGLTLRLVRGRLGNGWMLALAPFIWTGLEYFRSELYYLRFGWLTFGMASHGSPVYAAGNGVFGFSFFCVTVAAITQLLPRRWKRGGTIILALCAGLFLYITSATSHLAHYALSVNKSSLPVAGVQIEFETDHTIIAALDRARASFPDTQLFMLSEYTFQTPPPQVIRDWCASNQVYLVVGGKEPLGDTNFFNTAYVIGTNGSVIHQQVKSVPIQFFKDGLPAPERKVWDSPWGKFGILTCYDLSYTRVVDDFVRQGAIALLNPTMDVSDWGKGQHELHSRIPPMRAAEYGIPIFRVASSGISQLVSQSGRVIATAPYQDEDYTGKGEIISGQLPLNAKPRLPLDRWVAPGCVAITGLALGLCMLRRRVPVPSQP